MNVATDAGIAPVVLVSLEMSAYAPAVGTLLVLVGAACAGAAVAAAPSTRARAVIRRGQVV